MNYKNKYEKILCIHRGHGASCSLMVDGKIIAAAQEERFSRIKNDTGFPYYALKWCLSFSCIKLEEVDIIAYSSNYFPSVYTKSKHRINFDMSDYIEYYENGAKKMEGEYANGLKNGKFSRWDENGVLLKNKF